jgi:hypothetical protein
VEPQSLEPPGKLLSKGVIQKREQKTAAKLEEILQSKNKLKAEPLKKMEQDQQ